MWMAKLLGWPAVVILCFGFFGDGPALRWLVLGIGVVMAALALLVVFTLHTLGGMEADRMSDDDDPSPTGGG